MPTSDPENRRIEGLCPRAEDAASYARNELPPDQRPAFEQHLRNCADCRTLVDDFRKVLARLEQRPADRVSHDLSADVLQRIPKGAWRNEGETVPFAWLSAGWLRAAASLLVIVCGALLLRHVTRQSPTPDVPPPVAQTGVQPQPLPEVKTDVITDAIGWLVSAQEPSGAWDPARWGGKNEYEVSLTGMALLALMKDKEGVGQAAREKAVDRGLDYLLSRQAPDGAFGPKCTGRMYNQGMATLACLEAYRLKDGPRMRAVVDRALRYIADQQHDTGGWGYQKGPMQTANTSITAWQMKALFSAWQSGWTETDVNLRRGIAWLRSVVDEQGLFGYQRPQDTPDQNETLTAMGALCFFLADSRGYQPQQANARIRTALRSAASDPGKQPDYYRWYFVASALSAGKQESFDQLLADLHKRLISERSRDTSNPGSWDPVGRWSSVGGRLYTTTMATLSLEEGI